MAPKKTADVLAEASAKSGLEGLRVLVRRQDDARAALGALPKARAAKFFRLLPLWLITLYLHDREGVFHGGRNGDEHERNRAKYGVY